MKVHKETNYSKFKLMKGNREIDSAHVARLEKSILKNNLLEQRPILVNEEYYVVDGQHRLQVAIKNKLPIFYSILDEGSIDEVILLNTAQKNWGLIDYLKLWVSRRKPDYELLLTFVRTYELPVSVSASLLGGSYSGSTLIPFKQGKFVAKNLKHAESVGNALRLVRKHTKAGIWRSRDFVVAIGKLIKVPGFSMDRFLNRLEVSKPIEKQMSIRDYLRAFEDVYNFRLRSKSYLHFT